MRGEKFSERVLQFKNLFFIYPCANDCGRLAQFAHISKEVARGQAVWFLQWQPFLTKTKLIRGRNVMNKLDTWNPVFCKIFLTVCALIITGLTGPASAQAQGYTVTGHVLSSVDEEALPGVNVVVMGASRV